MSRFGIGFAVGLALGALLSEWHLRFEIIPNAKEESREDAPSAEIDTSGNGGTLEASE